MLEWLYAINEAACTFWQREFRRNQSAQVYAGGRGMGEKQLEQWRIGYCGGSAVIGYLEASGYSAQEIADAGIINPLSGKVSFTGRVIFPVFEPRWGMVVGFGARQFAPSAVRMPKYINSPESPIYHKQEILYGLNFALDAIRTKRRVILTEGYMDVIPLVRAQFPESVACCGTSITERQLYLLRLLGVRCYALFDGDSAGHEAGEKFSGFCKVLRIDSRVCHLPTGFDAGGIAGTQGPSAIEQILTDAK